MGSKIMKSNWQIALGWLRLFQDTEQRLARAQDDLSQRSLDAAEALTQLGEELAQAQPGRTVSGRSLAP